MADEDYSQIAQEIITSRAVGFMTPYITLQQVQAYEHTTNSIINKYQPYTNNQFIFKKYLYSKGKQYFQPNSQTKFKQTSKLIQINDCNYLIDVDINGFQCSHHLKVQLPLPKNESFEVTMVDDDLSARKAIKYRICNRLKSMTLKIMIPINKNYKIWKELEISNNQQTINFNLQQNHQSIIVTLNQFQFKLLINPYRMENGKYTLRLPWGVKLQQVQLVLKGNENNMEKCKCANSCQIY